MNWNAFSDHAALHFSFLRKPNIINIGQAQTENNNSFQQKIAFNEDMVPNYKELLQQNIHTFDLNYNSCTNISNKVEFLTKFLHENALKVFGVNVSDKSKNIDSNTFSKSPKWFDESCHNAKRDFKNARNVFIRNKTVENRGVFVKMRTKYNNTRRKAKYNYKKMEEQRLENIAKSQPKKVWKSLKKCYTKPKHSNNDINLENLPSHFKDLLGQIPENNHTNEQDLQGQTNTVFDSIFIEQEIRKAVFKQKNGNSSGPDDLTTEIVKASYDIISSYIVFLFNNLLDKSEYPENWGLGYIAPIFKGGDSKDATNYRGITLNNILAKIYSLVLLNRLTA